MCMCETMLSHANFIHVAVFVCVFMCLFVRDWVLLNKVRGQDVQLLKALRVDLICDLMVEKKKLKYGL